MYSLSTNKLKQRYLTKAFSWGWGPGSCIREKTFFFRVFRSSVPFPVKCTNFFLVKGHLCSSRALAPTELVKERVAAVSFYPI